MNDQGIEYNFETDEKIYLINAYLNRNNDGSDPPQVSFDKEKLIFLDKLYKTEYKVNDNQRNYELVSRTQFDDEWRQSENLVTSHNAL